MLFLFVFRFHRKSVLRMRARFSHCLEKNLQYFFLQKEFPFKNSRFRDFRLRNSRLRNTNCLEGKKTELLFYKKKSLKIDFFLKQDLFSEKDFPFQYNSILQAILSAIHHMETFSQNGHQYLQKCSLFAICYSKNAILCK